MRLFTSMTFRVSNQKFMLKYLQLSTIERQLAIAITVNNVM